MVNLHVNDFLQVGGDPKWLNGLDGAPQKLQHLSELNKILAHRPWLLTKEHIEVKRTGWERAHRPQGGQHQHKGGKRRAHAIV